MRTFAATLAASTLVVSFVACDPTPVQPEHQSLPMLAANSAGTPAHAGMNREIASIRAATARFHDVRVAEAAGYVPVSPCVAHPELGAMGTHYGRPDLMGDADFITTEPELLLYLPMEGGGMKLVGVEYWITEAAWTAAGRTGTPALAGQPFDHSHEEHGMPARYTLHVWTWAPNPAGMFAPFNPRLACPPEPQANDATGHASH
jgi:hypothetical protein